MNKPNRPQQMTRNELFNWVSMLGFCAFDMALYLDTHPDDEEALNYFNQCNELYRSARDTYEEQFGALRMIPNQPLDSWDWNTAPMPWEGGR